MRVYVINLDRAPERLIHMQNQFERLGISFTRVAAVDAKSMTKEQIESFMSALADSSGTRSWTPGGLGCFLSHKKAWTEIGSSGEIFSAVFEDDVHLSERIAMLLKNSEWIHKSADIVRFETTLQGMKLERVPVSEVNQMKVFKVCAGAWGTAGYVIRRDIAEWLASSPLRTYGPPDWFMFHKESAIAQALHVFQCDPAPCVQDQYHPDVLCRRNFDKVTQTPTGLAHNIESVSRRMLSPLIRKLTARRGVPFA